ncbi:MAG: bacteriophage holin [Chlamydiota bacterium]|nr:bacteriophage holin [Chlamydiota bacterium]
MLSAKRLGIAGGILWGMSLFLVTIANILFGYGSMFMGLMADVYPGFHVGYVGSLIGFVYGFLDGFVGLYILAWLYNKIRD